MGARPQKNGAKQGVAAIRAQCHEDEEAEAIEAIARGPPKGLNNKSKKKKKGVPNDTMCNMVATNVSLFGPPRASKADRAAVEKMRYKQGFTRTLSTGHGSQGRGSSDEANVSWLAPMGRFTVACYAIGTPGHHRDLAAQAVLPFADRAIFQAAKIFAGAALDLFQKPDLLAKVKSEFRRKTKGFKYDPLIPKRQKVPVDPP